MFDIKSFIKKVLRDVLMSEDHKKNYSDQVYTEEDIEKIATECYDWWSSWYVEGMSEEEYEILLTEDICEHVSRGGFHDMRD